MKRIATTMTIFGEREAMELETLLRRCRAILHKFSMRFADSEHARAHQKEARLTIEAIDEQLLKL